MTRPPRDAQLKITRVWRRRIAATPCAELRFRVSRAALLLGDLRHDHPGIGHHIDPILWLLAGHQGVDDE